MMKIRVILTLLIIFSIDLFSQVKGGEQKKFTLDDCIKTALKKNFDIQLTDVKKEAANAGLTTAYGAYLPQIGVSMGYQRYLNVEQEKLPGGYDTLSSITPYISGTDPNSYSMNATANLIVFDGFNREANYYSAKEYINSVDMSSRQTVKNVIISIYRQYVDVIKNMQIAKVRRDNLALGNKELESIQAQYNAGVIPLSNVYSQEADLANRELDLVLTENDINHAKANILTTIGYNPDMNLEFEVSSLPDNIDVNEINNFAMSIGSLDNMISKALNNRFDYSASKSSIESAKYRVTANESGYYPKIYASGGWNWANSKFEDFNTRGRSFVAMNLSIPIFDNFTTNNQIQNAKLQLQQSEVESSKLEQSIRAQVQAAYLNLQAAEKGIAITDKALKAAQINYESTSERFKAGASNITELQVSNNQLINIQVNRIRAVYSYILAQKEVQYAMGEL